MQMYYGTKCLQAEPMTRGQYNAYRGWTIPADENPDDPGYLVEYQDGGEPNIPIKHAGYVSWSPKDVFEASYRPTTGMSFGHALTAMKDHGRTIAREKWNDLKMALRMSKETNGIVRIRMETSFIITIWSPSQDDLLANDWRIVQ